MKQPKKASTAIETPEASAAPTTRVQQPVQQPVQSVPWFATRDEQIRMKALELAVQTQSGPNKVQLAREYMQFLKPEEDVVA